MFDLSGSGTVFNPFANVNETALAKIVAGWEADGEAMYDLYGFVPRGQLAIYRTGNGYSWNVIENSADRTYIGDFNDNSENPDGVLSVGDTITIGDFDYEIVTALSQTTITNPTITIGGTEYSLSEDSPMFIAKCPAEAEGCTDFAIYVGLDGAWYIKNTGGNYDIDAVYILTGNEIFTYKTKETADYQNFSAMYAAMQSSFSGNDSHNPVGVDVIANTNILSSSRDNNYITVDTFSGYANAMGETDLSGFYLNKIGEIYGASQGGINGAANDLFGSYGNNDPMLIMPAGEYLYRDSSLNFYLPTPTATFENYAPLIYENLNHNFMTIIAVSHDTGTSAASTISGYGNGVGSDYGPLSLSIWYDSTDPATANVYSSRRCGIAGVGDGNIDPWCFAAAGPTAEMATASAAGAVASLKSAFDYMTNDQIFALLALTADGPYLATSTDPTRPDLYTPFSDETLVVYLKSLYRMPNEYEYNISSLSDAEYLELFKEVFGYGLINLERAIRPGRSVSYYSSGHIVLASGDAYWRSGSMAHASNVLSLTGSGSITTSFYDVLESIDGSLSLPRIWTNTIAMNDLSQYGLYMGDVLGDFDIDSNRQKSQKIGGLEFAMSLSPREYNDNLNGLDNLRIAFSDNRFGLAAEYQRYLTDGESRFAGRANGVLALASNALSSDAEYKIGNFSFGVRAFNGVITDESLLENDPVVSSQYEPGRLGFVNGGLFATKYKNDKFAFDVSVGIMNETNTVLGMYSDGLLSIGGGKTQYVDAVADYKPTENVRLSLRGTFAKTRVNEFGGVISEFSDIKSNAFALGVDIGGFGFTVAAPLAVVDGKMGYDYADFEIVENNGRYELAMNNAHTEYIDLAANNRELRFTTSYKKSFGETTDAGIEFMYRVNPGNIDTFGNESILMLKIHHRIGL